MNQNESEMPGIIPDMPEGPASHEDVVFNKCCNIRALFQIPESMPLVETGSNQLADWKRMWDLLLKPRREN